MTDCLVRFEDVQFLRKDFRRFFEALVSRLCKSYSRNPCVKYKDKKKV